jgi:hypothetical protein
VPAAWKGRRHIIVGQAQEKITMPFQRYQITNGGRAQDVVRSAGGAVGSEVVQVNVDWTNMTKVEVLLALDHVKEAINEGPWPPA